MFAKVGLKFSYFCEKKLQSLRALGTAPPQLKWPAAAGNSPPDPPDNSPIADFCPGLGMKWNRRCNGNFGMEYGGCQNGME